MTIRENSTARVDLSARLNPCEEESLRDLREVALRISKELGQRAADLAPESNEVRAIRAAYARAAERLKQFAATIERIDHRCMIVASKE